MALWGPLLKQVRTDALLCSCLRFRIMCSMFEAACMQQLCSTGACDCLKQMLPL